MITCEADIWPWLMLRNAIVQQAVYDYEALISEGPLPVNAGASQLEMSIPAIRQFTKDTDADEWLDKIDRLYFEEFKPYAKRHADEIIEDWKEVEKLEDDYARRRALKNYKHRCPMCGGAMRPITSYGVKLIGCNFCYLNAKIPTKKEEKQCSTQE